MIKIIGAALVVAGCTAAGFSIAAVHLREIRTLQQLMRILDFIECELQYRLTPLPDLCRQVAQQSSGLLKRIFDELSVELDSQVSPDASYCVRKVMANTNELPKVTYTMLEELGTGLGAFDLNGQISSLEAVRQKCRTELNALMDRKDERVRCYQTLGVCAGAALTILLI